MIRTTGLALGALVLAGLAGSTRTAVLSYDTQLMTGPNESPANASPATGQGHVDYDNVTHMLHVHVTFSGLLGTTTASHIHATTSAPLFGTAGVATTTPTFASFPLGVTSGVYDNTLDLTLASSYNPAFVTANGGSLAASETALMTAIANRQAYWNIHTSSFPGGEIRGFLPEPGTIALVIVGALVSAPMRRRRGAMA